MCARAGLRGTRRRPRRAQATSFTMLRASLRLLAWIGLAVALSCVAAGIAQQAGWGEPVAIVGRAVANFARRDRARVERRDHGIGHSVNDGD